jgi:hypothetical protein
MSEKNSGGRDLGGLLGGIAALVTALVGLFVYLGIQLKLPGQTPENQEIPEETPPPSSNSPCPSETTFSALYAFNLNNALQAKDVCENQTLTLIGYLSSDSIDECPYQNELNETVQGRCLRIFHDQQLYSGSSTVLQYSDEKKDLLIEINKSLYQHGNHKVTIRAKVSFAKDVYQRQIISFDNVKILSYKPLSDQ